MNKQLLIFQTKTCVRCKKEKNIDSFGARTRNSDGKRGVCKPCEIIDRKGYETPQSLERDRKYAKDWYWNNKEHCQKRQKIWCENNKEHRSKWARQNQLKTRYGITPKQYDEMALNQDYKCKICNTNKPGNNSKFFYVDHCHATKKVRGLLCVRCNMAIGQFFDKVENIRRAADYVENNGRI